MPDLAHLYSNDFFDQLTYRSLQSARVILPEVFAALRPRRVIDVGCGLGAWLRAAADLGAEETLGVDGQHVDCSKMLIDPTNFIAGNLADQRLRDLLRGRMVDRFDLAICLEFAEHLPFGRAPPLVEDLTDLADVILFSAALPFQSGVHHVNEQWPEFWAIQFRARGYHCYDWIRRRVWNDPDVEPWYAQNVLLLAKEGSEGASRLPAEARTEGGPLAFVHPQTFLANLLQLYRTNRKRAYPEEYEDFQTLARANRRQETMVPPLLAIARARAAAPDARDVFPWTRTEIGDPEEIAEEHQKAIEALASEAEARRRAEAAGQHEAARRISAERHAETAKARAAEEARLRANAEQRAVQVEQHAAQVESRLAATEEQLAAQQTELANFAARAAQAEAERDRLQRERDAVLSSTFWRITRPGRRLATATPPSLRRQMRRSARVCYWLLTPHRTRERIAYFRAGNAGVPISPAVPGPPNELFALESSCDAEWDAQQFGEIARWPENPASVASLCNELLRRGLVERAEQVGRAAMEQYPNDPELVELCRKIAASRVLLRSGLFDPVVYRSLHPDLNAKALDPWTHFITHGVDEARPFTNCEHVARVLTDLSGEIEHASREFKTKAKRALAADGGSGAAALLRRQGVRIGVFCSRAGNFFMQEIANLLAWGMEDQGIDVVQRDEAADFEEPLDLRIFIAPQEFFFLGRGRSWMPVLDLPTTVLFNVDQLQSSWFCRALPLLSRAALVLDINFQCAEVLRRAGCNAIHLMPGHLPHAPYSQACEDVSDIELVKGYDFARRRYNWLERNALEDRPINVLFVGTQLRRRNQILLRLQAIADAHRFVCATTPEQPPMTARNHRATSTEINCALGQRAKIVLNIHRDWLGYFEWSRMVLQGFWQGACVVSDPCLAHPIFKAGTHYLEESTRHIGELVRWLLETREGQEELDKVRLAGHRTATTLGSMRVALEPALEGFVALLSAPASPNESPAPHAIAEGSVVNAA